MDKSAAFVSYSRKDLEFVQRLVSDLKAAGASVWLDKSQIKAGMEWDRSVEEALMACPRMLLVLSPTSAASPNVLDEIAVAMRTAKTIVPILYQECTIPIRVCRLQYIDFRMDYESGLRELVERLGAEPGEKQAQQAAKAKEAAKAKAVRPRVAGEGDGPVRAAARPSEPQLPVSAPEKKSLKKMLTGVVEAAAIVAGLIFAEMHFEGKKNEPGSHQPAQTAALTATQSAGAHSQAAGGGASPAVQAHPGARIRGWTMSSEGEASAVDARLQGLFNQTDLAALQYLGSPDDKTRNGSVTWWKYRHRGLMLMTQSGTVTAICYCAPGFEQFTGSGGDVVKGIRPGMLKGTAELLLGAPTKDGGIFSYSYYDQAMAGRRLSFSWSRNKDGQNVARQICLENQTADQH